MFLPGKSHGQRSLKGYSPWGHKELSTTEATKQQQPTYTLSVWSLLPPLPSCHPAQWVRSKPGCAWLQNHVHHLISPKSQSPSLLQSENHLCIRRTLGGKFLDLFLRLIVFCFPYPSQPTHWHPQAPKSHPRTQQFSPFPSSCLLGLALWQIAITCEALSSEYICGGGFSFTSLPRQDTCCLDFCLLAFPGVRTWGRRNHDQLVDSICSAGSLSTVSVNLAPYPHLDFGKT